MASLGFFDKIKEYDKNANKCDFQKTAYLLNNLINKSINKEDIKADFIGQGVVLYSKFEAIFEEILTSQVHFFVQPHELGHAIGNHFTKTQTRHIEIVDHNIETSTFHNLTENHADIIATNLLCDHSLHRFKDDELSLDLSLCSITLFFALLDIFEKKTNKSHRELKTHLEPYIRLDMIYSAIEAFEEVSIMENMQFTRGVFLWYERVFKVLNLGKFYGDGILLIESD